MAFKLINRNMSDNSVSIHRVTILLVYTEKVIITMALF